MVEKVDKFYNDMMAIDNEGESNEKNSWERGVSYPSPITQRSISYKAIYINIIHSFYFSDDDPTTQGKI